MHSPTKYSGVCILVSVLLGLNLPSTALAGTAQSSPTVPMTEAEILSRLADFQRRPRRLFISPGTSHPGFQKYLKTWRAHLRQISASWDWDAALPADQTGEAILTIAIDHNGRIERVEIARSSGSETIDQTLLALAQDASPFPAPPYGDEYDILHITATMGVTSYRSDDNRVAEPRAGKARATPAQ